MRSLKSILGGNGNGANNGHVDNNRGFYSEDSFHKALSLERKKSERSKKPFMLALVIIDKSAKDKERKKILNKLMSVFVSSPREIDVKGWYKSNEIIGIIFTEINGVGHEIIRKKLNSNVFNALDKEQIQKIVISFHMFPEERYTKKPQDSDYDRYLYPDLAKEENSTILSTIKRTIDIIGGALGIIIFSPFFLILPVLIKLTSRGPVFYKQPRLGQHGGEFAFIKFRSMYIDSDDRVHQEYIKEFIANQKSVEVEKSSGKKMSVFKLQNDTRITPLGKFLRKTSLDEIPQFFNVLLGDMSLVGPRPPIPYELENYDIWHRRRFLEVKPGITGFWQVYGRSLTNFDDMVRMDLQYIKNRSLLWDIKLLFMTPFVVLTCKGGH